MKILDEIHLLENEFNRPGVYKIYLHLGENPLHINRICNIDKSGLLYIGSSKSSMAYRLKCFIRSMDFNRKQNNHSAGVKVQNSVLLRDLIEKGCLYFECSPTKSNDAHDSEIKALNEYKKSYGEVPPLNG
jgi:hypothetical protein